jgi:hypothetical protein
MSYYAHNRKNEREDATGFAWTLIIMGYIFGGLATTIGVGVFANSFPAAAFTFALFAAGPVAFGANYLYKEGQKKEGDH